MIFNVRFYQNPLSYLILVKGLLNQLYKISKVAFVGCLLANMLYIYTTCFVATNYAQAQDEQADIRDPLTEAIVANALLSLRFLAISLQGHKDEALALHGVVVVSLVHHNFEDALLGLAEIKHPIWRARSLLAIANYLIENDKADSAIDYLYQTAGVFEPIEKYAPIESNQIDNNINRNKLLMQIAESFLTIGSIDLIDFVMSRMSDPEFLLTHLESIAERARKGNFTQEQMGQILLIAQKLYGQIINMDVSAFPEKDLLHARIIFLIAQTDKQADIGQLIDELTGGDSATKLSMLDAKTINYIGFTWYVQNDHGRAMKTIREIIDPVKQRYAFASMARFRDERGDIEAAVPLFALAKDGLESIRETAVKDDLLSHIAIEQTRTGLLADAFVTLGAISQQSSQTQGMVAMGQELLKKGEFFQARKLLNYISDLGLRAEFSIDLARKFYQKDYSDGKHQPIILDALNYNLSYGDDRQLFRAILKTINAQAEIGHANDDDVIYQRGLELVEEMNSSFYKGMYLIYASKILSSRFKLEEARRQLTTAGYLIVDVADVKQKEKLQHALVIHRLNLDQQLDAYDTAVRIREPTEEERDLIDISGHYTHPRYASLIAVARNAARQKNGEFAARVVDSIEYFPARAQALVSIAIAASLGDVQPPEYTSLFSSTKDIVLYYAQDL